MYKCFRILNRQPSYVIMVKVIITLIVTVFFGWVIFDTDYNNLIEKHTLWLVVNYVSFYVFITNMNYSTYQYLFGQHKIKASNPSWFIVFWSFTMFVLIIISELNGLVPRYGLSTVMAYTFTLVGFVTNAILMHENGRYDD